MFRKIRIWFLQWEIEQWNFRLFHCGKEEASVIAGEQSQRRAKLKELQ